MHNDKVARQAGMRHSPRMSAFLRSVSPLLALGLAACSSTHRPDAEPPEHDLVIYGLTSAGVASAIQASRMGLDVVLVGPGRHLGGLSASGLGWTDSGNKAVIGGVALDFYRRIYEHYDRPEAWKWQERSAYGNRGQGTPAMDGKGRAMWVFEPHVAERIFEELVAEHQIPRQRNEWLDRSAGAVEMQGARILSIRMFSGRVYRARQFIDASYEGDLMAAAGCSFVVGRESNEQYGETLNGVQKGRPHHQFERDISPYRVPGDPTSGLLPRVSDQDPGRNGQGDHRVQAYNFRVCLTRVPENRVPFPKPNGYDPKQYELLLRTLLAGSRHVMRKFDVIPNAKTDTNNAGSFSTDNIGMNYDYPTASYARRREIIEEHRVYQQGYFWFLANDPRVPADVRAWYSEWGLAKDEFADNDNWPHQIYVREARRMVGDFVVTENHLRRKLPTPRSIAMGSYNMDSHHTQRYVDENGFVRNEGDVQVNPGGPYPIDFGAILPKKSECQNLLVTCAVSSSHIAYGSVRMEPVFMILGQSATTAAAIAIEHGTAVQDVDYPGLARRLESDGQVLEYSGGIPGGLARGISRKKLAGIVIDDTEAALSGAWSESISQPPYVHRGYRHDGNQDKGKKSAVFAAKIPAGRYELRLSYSPHANRASNVPVTIEHANGSRRVSVDQRAPLEADFVSLGRFDFGERVRVTISNADTDGYVVVDAVQLLPMP
jgi:hypothetical protein